MAVNEKLALVIRVIEFLSLLHIFLCHLKIDLITSYFVKIGKFHQVFKEIGSFTPSSSAPAHSLLGNVRNQISVFSS